MNKCTTNSIYYIIYSHKMVLPTAQTVSSSPLDFQLLVLQISKVWWPIALIHMAVVLHSCAHKNRPNVYFSSSPKTSKTTHAWISTRNCQQNNAQDGTSPFPPLTIPWNAPHFFFYLIVNTPFLQLFQSATTLFPFLHKFFVFSFLKT